MSTDPTDTSATNEPAQEEQKKPRRRAAELLAKLLTKKGFGILLGVSIVLHGIGFAYYRLGGKQPPSTPSPEVSLGEFGFVADPAEGGVQGGRVTNAEFRLHVALLQQVEPAARGQLAARKFRVREDIEELLRRAHSGDFDDPVLGDLKRRLQERINESLEMRAIADVIVTDLKLERDAQPIGTIREGAVSVPWVEGSSG